MDKDLILSEEKGERKLMVHDSRLMVKGSWIASTLKNNRLADSAADGWVVQHYEEQYHLAYREHFQRRRIRG